MDSQRGENSISNALGRARERWLNAATVNVGGKWAIISGLTASIVGFTLAGAGESHWGWLGGAVILGLAGVALALVLTRRAFSRPGRPGAPDFVVALDRALGLRDSLPALVESPGPFKPLLEARVASALTPDSLRRALPPRNFAPLAVALILCLMPLAGLAPDALEPQESQSPQTARDKPAQPGTAQPEPEDPAEELPAGEGQSQAAPHGREGGEGAQPAPQPTEGESPADMPQPEAAPDAPPKHPGAPGDKEGPPPLPPAPPEKRDVETRDVRVTPDAGEGETRREKRSRWMYDPHGAPHEGETRAPGVDAAGEWSIARQKLTAGERKRLEELYEKLYR